MKIQQLFVFFLFLIVTGNLMAQMEKTTGDTLVVLWVSGDRDVAEKSCLMYTHAAKTQGWFSEVILVIWGPSQTLATKDDAIREKLHRMQQDGVVVEACIACSNMLGVTEELKSCGADVKGMGVPLTEYLKKGYKVLTY